MVTKKKEYFREEKIMSGKQGVLLHTFNEYLNKQETKVVAPSANAEEQLRSYNVNIEREANAEQAQNNQGYLDFQVVQKNAVGGEQGAEEQALDEKLFRLRPEKLTDEERYIKMKDMLKSVQVESFSKKMPTLDALLEWAMSSAAVDGASDDFMAIVIALRDAYETDKKQKATEKKLAKIIEKQTQGKATEDEVKAAEELNHAALRKSQENFYKLTRGARDYSKSHSGHRSTEKGKSRQQLAEHILSSKFMEQYVIKLSPLQLEGSEFSEEMDGNTFNLAWELQEKQASFYRSVKSQVKMPNGQRRARYADFVMQDIDRLPLLCLYNQAKAVSSDEGFNEENEKVNNAIFAYTGKSVIGVNGAGEDVIENVPVNKEPMFSLMDDIVKEVCDYKITEKVFTKDFYIDHPEEIFRLRRISVLLGDCLDENGNVNLGNVGKDYLDTIKNNEAYAKFYAKLNFMTYLWFEIDTFLSIGAGIFVNEIFYGGSGTDDPVLDGNKYEGKAREDYDIEEYNDYIEQKERTPKEWLELALEKTKADHHVTGEMRPYLTKSIFSKIKAPKRNNNAR